MTTYHTISPTSIMWPGEVRKAFIYAMMNSQKCGVLPPPFKERGSDNFLVLIVLERIYLSFGEWSVFNVVCNLELMRNESEKFPIVAYDLCVQSPEFRTLKRCHFCHALESVQDLDNPNVLI